MHISPAIFKSYDILGKFPKELNAEVAKRIGNAVAVFLSRKYRKRSLTLLVGSDVRTSSPVLKKALIEGVVTQGSDVVDVGECTSPLFYFLLGKMKNDGGVMVTASHNPLAYNGFKIRSKTGFISGESGLGVVRKLAARNMMQKGKTMGEIRSFSSGVDEYVNFFAKKARIGKVRVVIDAAGGSAALVLPKLLSRFPHVLYKPLFFTVDGSFSVHDPNPLNEDAQLFVADELKNGSFDCGVLFDGDADRIIFCDEFGNVIRADFILALLAEELLKKHPKSWVVLDLTSSRAAEEQIRERGGRVVRSKVGSAHVQEVMKAKKAILAGELSGHYFFRELHYNESSMYVLLKILEILSRTPKKLSHVVRPLYRYVSGHQMNFKTKHAIKIMKALEQKYRKEKARISKLDGVSVEMPGWWFNIRPSNTEPLLRLTLEAKTRELFDEKQKELTDIILSHKS